MPRRECVAVDACCDLPPEFIKQNNIRILPIYLKMGDKTITDVRDPAKTIQYYREGLLDKNTEAETRPFSRQEMSEMLEQELVLNYDDVLAITMMSSRSRLYGNIRDAVWGSKPKFMELRNAAGLERRFRISVMDSWNLFTGPGVLAYEAIRLLGQEEMNLDEVHMKLDAITPRLHTYLVPKDLYHLKNRAGNRGDHSDNSLNNVTYQVGRMLNIKPIVYGNSGETGPIDRAVGYRAGLDKIFGYAYEGIDSGLAINVINMSYAGDLDEIRKEPGYQKLVEYAKERGVETMLSMMSTTAAINVGPGSFSLSYAD